MRAIRNVILRVVGVAGLILFSSFFALTYSVPEWVENFGADFIKGKVSTEVDQAIDALKAPEGEGALAKIAKAIEDRNADKIVQLKEKLRDQVHVQFANAIAEIRDLDCECREKLEQRIEQGFKTNITLLQAANDKLVNFIQSTYMDVVQALKHDIRIFTGLNAVMFMTLLLVSFMKPQAIVHLFVPGILLALSTVVCSYFYIFEQNWLLTIIYSDYLGFGYLAYLSMVFGLLCDIALNSGRITTEIINAILSAIGSVASVVPC